MTTCAVIDRAGQVVNLIVASPNDPIDDGLMLLANPPSWVVIGSTWNGERYILPPGVIVTGNSQPPVVADLITI